MRESTFIQGWIDLDKKEGMEKGKLDTLRETIRKTLTTRFGAVSAELLRRLDASTDIGQLDRAFEQALTVENPEDLRL